MNFLSRSLIQSVSQSSSGQKTVQRSITLPGSQSAITANVSVSRKQTHKPTFNLRPADKPGKIYVLCQRRLKNVHNRRSFSTKTFMYVPVKYFDLRKKVLFQFCFQEARHFEAK